MFLGVGLDFTNGWNIKNHTFWKKSKNLNVCIFNILTLPIMLYYSILISEKKCVIYFTLFSRVSNDELTDKSGPSSVL